MLILYFVISLIIHLVIIGTCILNAITFFKITSSSDPITKKIFSSLFLFFLLFAGSYVLRLIMVFILPMDLETFYNEIVFDRTEATQTIAVFYAFGIYITLMNLSIIVERAIFKLKTKFVFTFIILGSCLFIGLMMLISAFSYYDATHLQIIPLIVAIIIITIFSIAYIRMGILYEGIVRKKSFLIASGLIFLELGLLFSSKGVIQFSFSLQVIVSPLLILFSVILLRLGYSKEGG